MTTSEHYQVLAQLRALNDAEFWMVIDQAQAERPRQAKFSFLSDYSASDTERQPSVSGPSYQYDLGRAPLRPIDDVRGYPTNMVYDSNSSPLKIVKAEPPL